MNNIDSEYRKFSKTESKEVIIRRCTHLGGHGYAGNVTIWRYSTTIQTYFGDWFGYVSMEDVSEKIIQKYILNGIISKEIYRGRTDAKKETLLNLMKFKPNLFCD
jgi:hypothetical protein